MTEPEQRMLVLVDGSSYLYRAFHALPPLTNSKGAPTGAVYGVVNMLRKLLVDYDPHYVAVVFDAKGKTFRDDLFEQYKAHRPAMPDDLRSQIAPLHAVVQALGLPLLIIEGVEADDVIGTLAIQATKLGIHTVISTSDKDMAQLVDSHVTLINTMSDTKMDRQGVMDKFGVPPEQIVDYLALVGDTSDNIPGIPKVGPKTAAKWLIEYGSLDKIVDNAANVPGKVGENLQNNLHLLPLSKQLATIRCEVPLTVGPLGLERKLPDIEALRDLYRSLEFKQWLAGLPQEEIAHTTTIIAAPRLILDEQGLDGLISELNQAQGFALALSTDATDYMQANIVGITCSSLDGPISYIPLHHRYLGAPTQLAEEFVLRRLQPALQHDQLPKLGHNLKFTFNVLDRHHIRLADLRYDTMLESYVLNSTATNHSLNILALQQLGHEIRQPQAPTGRGAKAPAFGDLTIEEAANFAADSLRAVIAIHEKLWPQLTQLPQLQGLFEQLEMPLSTVLSQMERRGVLIDAELLCLQSVELTQRIQEIEQEAYKAAGRSFNLGSPKQIQEILYDELGLPVLQKTPKGQPSTAESVLQELALDYPLPSLILEHRGLSKLKSTYVDALPLQINPTTGRVHTSYQQAVAATGRLSSTDPNLQNIPIRTKEGRRIRQAFIAPPSFKIVAADYSQIELRIMAHLSGDERLVRAFRQGEDIHQATAAEIFSVEPTQVSHDQRRSAKAINFGLIYGMSSFGLARQLGIGRKAAQEYVDLYFARYPGVKIFMEQMRTQARHDGYVETVFGRRLYLPDINARDVQRRQYAERSAINAPMQGTAADIIKLAMLNIHRCFHETDDARMIMQVHDELVFEVRQSALPSTIERIRHCMTSAAELDVPLVVDVGMGDNWDEAH